MLELQDGVLAGIQQGMGDSGSWPGLGVVAEGGKVRLSLLFRRDSHSLPSSATWCPRHLPSSPYLCWSSCWLFTSSLLMPCS